LRIGSNPHCGRRWIIRAGVALTLALSANTAENVRLLSANPLLRGETPVRVDQSLDRPQPLEVGPVVGAARGAQVEIGIVLIGLAVAERSDQRLRPRTRGRALPIGL